MIQFFMDTCTSYRKNIPLIFLDKVFVRQMHDATYGKLSLHYSIRLKQEMKQEFRLWIQYFQIFDNKVSFSGAEWSSQLILHLYTDNARAQDHCCEAHFLQEEWYYYSSPAGWDRANILLDMTISKLISCFVYISFGF